MTVPETQIYTTVETGPGCILNSSGKMSSVFNRVLVQQTKAHEHDIVFLTEVRDPRNYHSESIDKGLSYEEIDKNFSQCPCHDPANADKNLGWTGCLALVSLNQKEGQ